MKRGFFTIEKVREDLIAYKDIPITLKVNSGRNKIVSYDCKIVELYPKVFQVELDDNQGCKVYSYSGVICGEIKLKKREMNI